MAENLPQPDQAVSDMDAAVKAAQRERSALEAKQQQQRQQAVARLLRQACQVCAAFVTQ